MIAEPASVAGLVSLIQFLKDAGIVGLLVFILIGGSRQWWVWGYQFRDLKQERDWWRDTALRGTQMAERAVDIAAKR